MHKIALIGYGSMGKNHARIVNNIPELDLCAICEPSIDEKEINGVPVFSDIDSLIKSVKPQSAIVCVPTALHKEISLKLINAKIDVLIEKPVASNVEDAAMIGQEAEKMGVKVAVGHVERFNPVVQSLKNEIREQDVYNIKITRVGPFPPRIADVGVLTDLAVHDIDLIRFLSGKEILDWKIFKSQKIHNHHEDTANLNFILEDDMLASISTNWVTPFKRRNIEVATKSAYFDAQLMSQELTEFSSYKLNNSFVSRGCFVKKGEPLLGELTAWHHYVTTGEIGNLATVQDSLVTLRIVQ